MTDLVAGGIGISSMIVIVWVGAWVWVVVSMPWPLPGRQVVGVVLVTALILGFAGIPLHTLALSARELRRRRRSERPDG